MKINKEQKELLDNILANKEFLAEILKSAKENKYKDVTDLKIGDTIVIAGITWRKFKEDEDGNSYMLADEIYKESKFGSTNDWRDSMIRKDLMKLAEQIKEEIGDRLVPIQVDLLSHDGLDDYGTCEDLVSILTYDLYRNNRIKVCATNERFGFWLCTPSSALSGCGSGNVLYVDSNGSVYYNWYDNCGAVRPFFILSNL